jgi:hypothetical protein
MKENNHPPTTTIHTEVEGKPPITTTWDGGGIGKPP